MLEARTPGVRDTPVGARRRVVAVACALLGLASCSAAADSGVGGAVTPETLAAILANAKGGQTLRLRPGHYGAVRIPRRNFSPELTLEAEGAVFSAIDLTGVAGVTIREGQIVGPGGRSYGITIRQAQRVRIEGMRISGAHRGIVVGPEARDVAIVGNELTGLISDGINIALSRNVLVARNRCRAFTPRPAVYDASGEIVRDGDHPDCIQAWSRPSHPPTSDVQIVANNIEGEMQGIFLGNHVRNGVNDGGFDRVTVRGNRVRVNMPNGIVVGEARDSEISDNAVMSLPGKRKLGNKIVHVKANMRVTGQRNRICGNTIEEVPHPELSRPCRR